MYNKSKQSINEALNKKKNQEEEYSADAQLDVDEHDIYYRNNEELYR